MTKHYTVEEANQYLPTVSQVLREAVRLKSAYDRLFEGQETAGESASDAVDSLDDPSVAQKALQLRAEIGEHLRFLIGLGLQVKDLDVGLVDFPAFRDGEEVLLCWRLGEPEVAYWHTYQGGFPSRRHV